MVKKGDKEEENLFSRNPKCSFKMDKNSSFASKLKACIIDKLNQFFVNYTDDVLAEYIVVLVCNGKDQHQARDDLEAFLGERSGKFVSWLWDLLLKSIDHSHMSLGPSYLKDVSRSGCNGVLENKCRLRMLRGLRNHAKVDTNMLSDDEKEYCPSTFTPHPVSSNDNEESKGSHRSSPRFITSTNESNDTKGQTQTFKHKIRKKSGPTKDKSNEVLKYVPSRVKVSSGTSADGEQSVLYVDENKIVKDGLPRQHLLLPKKEPPPSNLQSVTRENSKYPSAVTDVAGRRSSSRPVDSVSHQNPRPRVSVWDRLGKAHDDYRIVGGRNIDSHGVDVVKRRIVELPGEVHDQKRLMVVVPGGRLNGRLTREIPTPDNSSGTFISNTNDDDEYERLEHDLDTVCLPQHADKFNKKRQFSEICSGPANVSVSLGESKYRHLQDRETLKELQRSSSAKYSRSESLNSIPSGSRQTEGLDTCQAFVTPDIAFLPGANNVPQRKLGGEVSEASLKHSLFSNHLATKSEALGKEDASKTDLKPVQAQMVDLKLRLHQMEMEMSKLRAKQLESNESKSDLQSISGSLNHADDDLDSRTVYVTNVHFAATKEALSLHFAKCGVVVTTIILNDAVTAQPKGAVYITFAHKTSAEKAVALSGTSFWSRTLKVFRKAEMPVVTLAPPQPAGKPSWPQSLRPNRNVVFPRPYASSLQWRRDQPVTTEHVISTPGLELEASTTAEQNGNDFGSKLHDLTATDTSSTTKEEEENPSTAKEENTSTAKEEEEDKDTSTAKDEEECKETHPASS